MFVRSIILFVAALPFSKVIPQDVDPTIIEAECPASEGNMTCGNQFEWPPSVHQFLTQLFPNVSEFTNAWEVHPLLSKIHPSSGFNRNTNNRIPTTFHNNETTTSIQSSGWTSMISVSDIPKIISQTPDNQPLIHGTDYKLVKKVILPPSHELAGEEYMGMLPKQHYSIQEVLHNFHHRGFSLVIDKVQKRWRSVADKARELEESLGVQHVGVNLYLTPEALEDEDGKGGWTEKQVRQGFEAHWDWMDVIVIQISGRKRWCVAKQPTIYLSNRDQKRKPTKEEVSNFFSENGHFSEFTLCPGDVLYIPRGFIHNASTVDFDELDDDPWNACPFSSVDSTLDQTGPSLHLTFGLEQSIDSTIEALLHHALHAYFLSSGFNQETIIPNCNATWKSMLHYSIGELARIKHECDYPSSNNTNLLSHCDGSALLRRSVPLFLHDSNGTTANNLHQYSYFKQMYQKSVKSFLASADMNRALKFAQSLLQPTETGLSFGFPGNSPDDVIACLDEMLLVSSALRSDYLQRVQSFVSFAEKNFEIAMQQMFVDRRRLREESQREQQSSLRKSGQ